MAGGQDLAGDSGAKKLREYVIPAKAGIQTPMEVRLEKGGFVYIITNKRNGTLYIGVTSNLPARIYQHKAKEVKSFSTKYGLDKLVCYEYFNDIRDAITREKQMKEWNRLWKLRVIETFNPNWDDLYETL